MKKLLLSLLSVLTVSIGAMAGKSYQLTDITNLKTGDRILIVDQDSKTAMPSKEASGSGPVVTAVTLDASMEKITSDVANDLLFEITVNNGSTASYAFVSCADESGMRLWCDSKNNGVRVTSKPTSGADSFEWKSNYLYNAKTSRYVGVYNSNTSDWRCYTTTTTNIKSTVTAFYKEVEEESGLEDAGLSFPEQTYIAKLGEEFTEPTLTKVTDAEVKYSSANVAVASVDEFTGKVTLHKAGSTTITASVDANAKYDKGSASYTLKVVDPNAKPWVRVASADDIVVGATYVISGGAYKEADTQCVVAVGFDNAGSNHFLKVSEKIDLSEDKSIAELPETNLQFVIEEASNGKYYLRSGDSYISHNSGNSAELGSAKSELTIEYGETTGYVTISKSTTTETRYLEYNSSGTRFAFYTTTPDDSKASNQPLRLYYQEGTLNKKKDPELSFSASELSIFEGAQNVEFPVLKNPNNLKVTYTSSVEEVAMVDEETGEVVLMDGIGTTVITASSEETEEFAAGEASYTLTVKAKPVLGAVTVNGAAVTVDDEGYMEEPLMGYVGESYTFAAENATGLTVVIMPNDASVMSRASAEDMGLPAGSLYEEVEGSSYVWTPTAPGQYMGQITATMGDDAKALAFFAVVQAAPCGEVEFNPASGSKVAEGTVVTVSAKNAVKYLYQVNDDIDEVEGESFTVTITEDCTIEVVPYNVDGVAGETAIATYEISNAVSDVLTVKSFTDITTGYVERKANGANGAKYSAWTCTNTKNGNIQANQCFALRTSSPNGALVVTDNNQKVVSGVSITQWKDQTSSNELKAIVFGSLNAFNEGKSLTKETLAGSGCVSLDTITLKKGEEVKCDIPVYYPYIAIVSNSGAIQMSEMKIDWEPEFEMAYIPKIDEAGEESADNLMIEGSLAKDGKVIITVKHNKVGAKIYHQHVASEPAARAVAAEPTHDSDGWKPVEGNQVTITEPGTFYFYATSANGKNRSKIRKVAITNDDATSISNINAAEAESSEYFDLQGRRVAASAKGIVIKKTGSKVSKQVR